MFMGRRLNNLSTFSNIPISPGKVRFKHTKLTYEDRLSETVNWVTKPCYKDR